MHLAIHNQHLPSNISKNFQHLEKCHLSYLVNLLAAGGTYIRKGARPSHYITSEPSRFLKRTIRIYSDLDQKSIDIGKYATSNHRHMRLTEYHPLIVYKSMNVVKEYLRMQKEELSRTQKAMGDFRCRRNGCPPGKKCPPRHYILGYIVPPDNIS